MSKKGGGDTPAVTTSIQKVELPAWVEAAGQNNYAQAQEVSKNLAGPYAGNTVAGMNGDHDAAFDMVRQGGNLAQPSMTQAANTLGQVQGYGGSQVGAGSFPGANLDSYMNPYSRNVIDAAQATERQTLAQNLNTIGDQATQAGAYGGSRQNIQQGVAQAQSAMNMGNLTAQLQNQNFGQAQSAIAADQNRQLTADQSNQSNSLEAQRLRSLAAAQGAQVGQMSQQANLQQASALQATADSERQYQQDLLNQDYQRYADARQQPIDQLNLLQYGLGVTPYGSTTSGTTTQTGGRSGSNGIAQALGAGGSILSSIMPMFGLLSDEAEKKNIVPLGKDPVTGTRVSAWQYKTDKGDGMYVSPTAQDLEKKLPGAVQTLPGGKKIVNAQVSADIGNRFLSGGRGPKSLNPKKASVPAPKKIESTKPKTPKSKQGMNFLGAK